MERRGGLFTLVVDFERFVLRGGDVGGGRLGLRMLSLLVRSVRGGEGLLDSHDVAKIGA